MNSLRRTTCVICTVLLGSWFLIAPVAAKKPPDTGPPPKSEDPCQQLDAFYPDVVYFLDTGRRKDPKVTFYVTDSDNGCTRELLDFSTLLGFVREVTFSAEMVAGTYSGRLVWHASKNDPREDPARLDAVWKYDFTVDGTEVASTDAGPVLVLENNEEVLSLYVYSLDLSPDGSTVAYSFSSHDWETSTTFEESIRILDIDDCVNAGCSYAPDASLAIASTAVPEEDSYLGYPTWDPTGSRVYFREYTGDGHSIVYVDVPTDWKDLHGPLDAVALVSSQEHPELIGTLGLAAGWVDREILAVVIPGVDKLNCGFVHFIDVDACEDGDSQTPCTIERKFYGNNPSWTREGKLIYNQWTDNHHYCPQSGGTFGIFEDGAESTFSMEGFDPDAAGGLPPKGPPLD